MENPSLESEGNEEVVSDVEMSTKEKSDSGKTIALKDIKNEPSVNLEDDAKNVHMVPDNDESGNDVTKPKPTKQKNYASKDSGALIMESSPGSKGSENLLLNSKDKYVISPCEEKIWVVVGLSEDILVRKVKLGSYEKYSRIVREFQVLGSHSFPVDKWLDLGTFTAANMHGEQEFDLPRPAFARYLKFKFLDYYGDDYYCTLSQIKVHGSTMIENFHQDLQASTDEVMEMNERLRQPNAISNPTNQNPDIIKVSTMPDNKQEIDSDEKYSVDIIKNKQRSEQNGGDYVVDAKIVKDLDDLEYLSEHLQSATDSINVTSYSTQHKNNLPDVLSAISNTSKAHSAGHTMTNELNLKLENEKNETSLFPTDEILQNNIADTPISFESKFVPGQPSSTSTIMSNDTYSNLQEGTRSQTKSPNLSVQNTTVDVSTTKSDEVELKSNDMLQQTQLTTKKTLNTDDKSNQLSFCDEMVSFAEFKERSLAKIQSKENAVTIEGQYENIFRTMLNKIKNLEINQNLFALYIDGIQSCISKTVEASHAQQKNAAAISLMEDEIEHLRKRLDEFSIVECKSNRCNPNHISSKVKYTHQQPREAWQEEKLFFSSVLWCLVLLTVILLVMQCHHAFSTSSAKTKKSNRRRKDRIHRITIVSSSSDSSVDSGTVSFKQTKNRCQCGVQMESR